MLIFENENHRIALEKLGLLPQGEKAVSPQELAQKTLELKQIDQGIYFIRQELALHLQNIVLLPSTFEMTDEQIKTGLAPDTLTNILKQVQTIQNTLENAQIFLAGIAEFTDVLVMELEKPSNSYLRSEAVAHQILQLRQQTTQLNQLLAKNQQQNLESIATLMGKIKGKR